MNYQIVQRQTNLKNINVLVDEKFPRRIPNIEIGGQKMRTSSRFWNSIYSKYAISDTFFKYFTHAEVFDRIKDSSDIQVTVDSTDKNLLPTALAISTHNKQIAQADEVVKLFNLHGGQGVTYDRGILKATFVPPSGVQAFKIGPDEFKNRYNFEIPLDGYGKPKTYLSLLRTVCENGLIAYSRDFESEINISRNPMLILGRALDSFDNDQGYEVLARRVEMAQKSFASFREIVKCEEMLVKTESGSKQIEEFREICGFVQKQYGIANPASVSEKKQMMLPGRVRVSEIIDFVTEVATHKTEKEVDRMKMHAHVGKLISKEFDLEGSAENPKEFRDLYLPRTKKKTA